MITEQALQRTFLAVGSLGRWEYLLHISCFLVFSDIILVFGSGVSIGEVDIDWLRLNASLGATLLILVGYSFVKAFLLPILDFLYFLFCALPVLAIRIRKLPQDEIDVRAWLAYSMLTRNTPAYREYERIRAKNLALEESSNNCRHLALLLLADLSAGMIASKSFTFDLFGFINSLQGGQRYLFLIPLSLFVLALGYNALLAPLGVRVSMEPKNRALLTEIRNTTKIQDIEQDTSESEEEGDV